MIEPELFNKILEAIIEKVNQRDGLLALDIRVMVWPYYEGTRKWSVTNLIGDLDTDELALTWPEFMEYKLNPGCFVDPNWSR